MSEATLAESESRSSHDPALLEGREDGLRFQLPTAFSPTLLGGCSLVFSTLLLLAEQEVVGPASLLGSTTPSAAFPRNPVLGGALTLTTGLDVLSLVLAAGRVDEAVLVAETRLGRMDGVVAEEGRFDEDVFAGLVDEAVLTLLPLSRRRCTAGGSSFMGLSCTKNVCRLMGLSMLVV